VFEGDFKLRRAAKAATETQGQSYLQDVPTRRDRRPAAVRFADNAAPTTRQRGGGRIGYRFDDRQAFEIAWTSPKPEPFCI
jgi:hypothetical protein